MAFNLNDYETVESRITKFWEEYPDGRIETELLEAGSNRFIVEARVFKTEADPKPFATDLACEMFKPDTSVAEFALERCSTSAIGRALATGGFATKKRSSREEMAKVNRVESESRSEVIANTPEVFKNDWSEFLEEKPTQEPVTLAQAAELVQQSFGEVSFVPTCSHGERTIKTGVSAAGKAWQGAMCAGKGITKSAQCPPIWYIVNKDGHFRLPEGVE